MVANVKKADKAGNQKPREVTFKCQQCEKRKPIREMTSVTRFRPVLIICQDCAKEMR